MAILPHVLDYLQQYMKTLGELMEALGLR